MKKLYVVDLTKEEKAELLELVRKGEARVRKMNRAHILLLADEGRTDKDIAQALHTRAPPLSNERAGALWKAAWRARPQRVAASSGGRRKLDGHQEAYLVALACSDPPEGKKRWRSMQMLADRLSWSSKWLMRSPMRR